jgi:hypothetical protein
MVNAHWKAFNAVAITNGETKYSVVTFRGANALGHYAWGVRTTQTIATLALTIAIQFNNRSDAEYSADPTMGWHTHEAVTAVAYSGTASHDLGVVSKPWKRVRLAAICTGGTGVVDGEGAAA